MKIAASALALAVLLAGMAQATHYEISEHTTTTIVHVEVLGGDHAKPAKGK